MNQKGVGVSHDLEAAAKPIGQALAHVESDEVELGFAFLEISVDHGRLLVATTTLAHQSSQSVCISNAGWLLDGTGDVVVVVAQLEGQQLNLVGRLANSVEQDTEAGWGRHALAGSHRDEVELVGVSVSDT